jgi:hypothetical protein
MLNNRHVVFCVSSIGWALWYPSALTFVMLFSALALLQCPAHVAAAFLDYTLCYNGLIFWLYFIYCIPTERTEVSCMLDEDGFAYREKSSVLPGWCFFLSVSLSLCLSFCNVLRLSM